MRRSARVKARASASDRERMVDACYSQGGCARVKCVDEKRELQTRECEHGTRGRVGQSRVVSAGGRIACRLFLSLFSRPLSLPPLPPSPSLPSPSAPCPPPPSACVLAPRPPLPCCLCSRLSASPLRHLHPPLSPLSSFRPPFPLLLPPLPSSSSCASSSLPVRPSSSTSFILPDPRGVPEIFGTGWGARRRKAATRRERERSAAEEDRQQGEESEKEREQARGRGSAGQLGRGRGRGNGGTGGPLT
eukprot:1738584-Rhodomonas_salina.2